MLGILSWIDSVIGFVARPRHEEDFVDRLNYRTTVSLLLFCALAIFAKDYGGDPLKCWGRGEWLNSWVEYAHDYCFIESTYYIPMSDPKVPADREIRRKAQLDYYQWVPFVLVFQALSYLLPEFFWKSFNWCSGFQVGTLLSESRRASKKGIEKERRDLIAMQITNALFRKKREHRMICVLPLFYNASRVRGSLTLIYFLTKLMLILNSCIHFYFLGYFLGSLNPWFGWSAIGALTNGKSWRDSGLFPRVTLCDFKIRGPKSGIEDYTVQCVLMGNMVNEKIFIALWWWMLSLALVSAFNLGQWGYRVLFKSQRTHFLTKSLLSSALLLYPDRPKQENGEDELQESGEEEGQAKRDEEGEHQDDSTRDSDRGSSAEQNFSDQVTTLNRSDATEGSSKERREKGPLELRKEFRQKVSKCWLGFLEHLGNDGVLMVDLIARNSNQLIASAVLGKCFENFVYAMEEQSSSACRVIQTKNSQLGLLVNPIHVTIFQNITGATTTDKCLAECNAMNL